MTSPVRPAGAGVSFPGLAAWTSVGLAGVLLITLQLGAPSWTVAGMAAGAVLMTTLLHPRWLLLALVVVEASNASGVLGTFGGLSVYLAVLAAATASVALNVVLGRVRLRYSPVILVVAIFIAAQVPSLTTARDGAAAMGVLVDLGKDLWFLVLVIALASSVSNAWVLARAFVVPISAIAAMSVVNQFVLGNTATFAGFSVVAKATGVGAATARHAGPFEDANFWGRILLLAFPLCLALLAEAMQHRQRALIALWAACGVSLLGGIYLTQSRGALLGLAVATVMFLAVTGARTRKLLKVLPVLAAVAVLLPGVGSRLATLDEVGEASSGLGDYSLVERTAAQQITMAMFTDHPIAGVGLGNIPDRWDEYDVHADITVRRQVAPHNLYLQLAAEGGLLGLAGWLIMFVGTILLAVRLILSCPEPVGGPVPRERLLASAAAASLVAWGTASVFLHLSYLRPVLVVFAIVAVLDLQTPRTRRPLSSFPRRRSRRERWRVVAAAVFFLVMSAVAYDAAGQYSWRARVTVAVVPTPGAAETAGSYDFDVLTRSSIMPTYAAVIDRNGADAVRRAAADAGSDPSEYELSAVGIPTAAVVRVDVIGPDSETAADAARSAAHAGADFANADPALGRLAQVSVDGSYVAEVRRWSPVRGGLVILAAAGAYLVARRLGRGRRQQAR